MFSGLVPTFADSVFIKPNRLRITIFGAFWVGVVVGESISVNGVCLTVAEINSLYVYFDLLEETLRVTKTSGGWANIERALRHGDRNGGHAVSGHVQTTGIITALKSHAGFIDFTVAIPDTESLKKTLRPKDSIAIDGVSLTVVDCFACGNCTYVSVQCVPTTVKKTIIQFYAIDGAVNIEA